MARNKTRLVIVVIVLISLLNSPARAEVYVGGQAGVSFPFDLRNVEGTGGIHGSQFSNLDLANTFVYGGKLGYFFEDPGWRWVGMEAEVLASNPHIKSQQVSGPGSGTATLANGAHVQAITTAFNLVARYPGNRVQPYAGIGLAFVNANISDETFSVSDSAPGLNVLAGLKVFLTSNLGIFGEFKYVYSSFQFEDATAFSGGIKGVYSAPAVVLGVAWHFR